MSALARRRLPASTAASPAATTTTSPSVVAPARQGPSPVAGSETPVLAQVAAELGPDAGEEEGQATATSVDGVDQDGAAGAPEAPAAQDAQAKQAEDTAKEAEEGGEEEEVEEEGEAVEEEAAAGELAEEEVVEEERELALPQAALEASPGPASTLDFARETLERGDAGERTAGLSAERIPDAPALELQPADTTSVPWYSELIEDEVDLSEPVLTPNSAGGEMVTSAGPEPGFDLVEELDPSVRFAEIGALGEEQLAATQAVLHDTIATMPGAEVLEGVDLDEAVQVEIPGLDATGADRLLDVAGDGLDVVTELDEGVQDVLCEGQAAQEALVDEGRETLQTAQHEAIAFGENTLRAGKDALLEQQCLDHEALGEAVVDGRDAIHDLWSSASEDALCQVAEAEAQAQAIRDHFHDLIDDLPSIPFIGRVIDRLVDEMLDTVSDMFGDVQGGIHAGFDAVRGEAAGLVHDLRSAAEEGYQAFDTHVIDNAETFATETVPGTIADVGELAEDVTAQVEDGVSDVAEDVRSGVEDAVEASEDGLSEGLGWVEDAAQDAVDWVEETGTDALDHAQALGADLASRVGAAGSGLLAWAAETGRDFVDVLADASDTTLSWLAAQGQAAWDGLARGGAALAGYLRDFGEHAWGVYKAVMDEGLGHGEALLNSLREDPSRLGQLELYGDAFRAYMSVMGLVVPGEIGDDMRDKDPHGVREESGPEGGAKAG